MNKNRFAHGDSGGFTLIELLVVIAIVAIMVAFAVVNFLGARQRAKDLKKQSELQQMKNALRLYYNDYTIYPVTPTGTNDLNGCGNAIPPVDSCQATCPTAAGAPTYQFAAGPTGCENVLMKLLPPATDYAWNYQQAASGDDFCLWTTLDNASDAQIAQSQAKCSAACTGVVPSTDYVVCAD